MKYRRNDEIIHATHLLKGGCRLETQRDGRAKEKPNEKYSEAKRIVLERWYVQLPLNIEHQDCLRQVTRHTSHLQVFGLLPMAFTGNLFNVISMK